MIKFIELTVRLRNENKKIFINISNILTIYASAEYPDKTKILFVGANSEVDCELLVNESYERVCDMINYILEN